mmetsp:Transcript_14672/g.33683  ORF Transcript_14672/g.33683 Transcript_14672/m.33683 type:complete len:216 (-) Transcript_14672:290-937(-)
MRGGRPEAPRGVHREVHGEAVRVPGLLPRRAGGPVVRDGHLGRLDGDGEAKPGDERGAPRGALHVGVEGDADPPPVEGAPGRRVRVPRHTEVRPPAERPDGQVHKPGVQEGTAVVPPVDGVRPVGRGGPHDDVRRLPEQRGGTERHGHIALLPRGTGGDRPGVEDSAGPVREAGPQLVVAAVDGHAVRHNGDRRLHTREHAQQVSQSDLGLLRWP